MFHQIKRVRSAWLITTMKVQRTGLVVLLFFAADPKSDLKSNRKKLHGPIGDRKRRQDQTHPLILRTIFASRA
jgi:hypothetical protein